MFVLIRFPFFNRRVANFSERLRHQMSTNHQSPAGGSPSDSNVPLMSFAAQGCAKMEDGSNTGHPSLVNVVQCVIGRSHIAVLLEVGVLWNKPLKSSFNNKLFPSQDSRIVRIPYQVNGGRVSSSISQPLSASSSTPGQAVSSSGAANQSATSSEIPSIRQLYLSRRYDGFFFCGS